MISYLLALETFLDAPVPYIMGLLRRTHDIELYKRGTVAIVDIDNGELVRIQITKTSVNPNLG
jgi:hypothetical protein